MAEVMFARDLAAIGVKARVESAGVGALVGEPADPMAVELCREHGLDLTAHRARQLTAAMARDFELILVMDAGHQRAVEAIAPTTRGKVHRVGRFGQFDVPDPYRRGREAFELAFDLTARGLQGFLDAFWKRRR